MATVNSESQAMSNFESIRHGLQMVRVRLQNHLIYLQNETTRILMVDTNGGSEVRHVSNAMDAAPGKISVGR